MSRYIPLYINITPRSFRGGFLYCLCSLITSARNLCRVLSESFLSSQIFHSRKTSRFPLFLAPTHLDSNQPACWNLVKSALEIPSLVLQNKLPTSQKKLIRLRNKPENLVGFASQSLIEEQIKRYFWPSHRSVLYGISPDLSRVYLSWFWFSSFRTNESPDARGIYTSSSPTLEKTTHSNHGKIYHAEN